MKNETQKYNELILMELTQLISLYPDQRFGQILFNIGVNEFADKNDPALKNYLYRDIYNDQSEKIFKRIKPKIEKIFNYNK